MTILVILYCAIARSGSKRLAVSILRSRLECGTMSTSLAEVSMELVRETEAPVFVINLCASTTPVALTHPASPELKRYTFFVTRQREEGRERFRLHMGYFDSLTEAEQLLATVRDVYPAAWVGPAPGNKPTPRASKPLAAAPAPSVAVTPAPVAVTPASVAVTPASTVVTAAPVAVTPPAAPSVAVAAVPVAAAPVEAPRPTIAAAIPAVAPAPPAMTAPVVRTTPVVPPRPVAAVAQAAPVLPPTVHAATPASAESAELSLASMSNVREVIAALADEPSRPARIPELKPAPPRRVPELKPAAAAAPVAIATPVATAMPVAEISDSQALRLLEQRASSSAAAPVDETVATSIKMLTPEDTQTLRDIKLEVQSNTQVSFAVQLMWSVSPIDMEQMPHLAIFDAYTLYNVEGNRQGRRWYGVRLGFFSDLNSAKQVAFYVRSDYTSVAVVPVTVKERDGARGGSETGAVQPVEKTVPPRPAVVKTDKLEASRDLDGGGFELLKDDRPRPMKRDMDDVPQLSAAKTQAPRVAAAAAGKAPAKKPTGKRAVARKTQRVPGAPDVLESTLEMLGASTLTIDNGREIINDSAIRKPVKKPAKPASRFSRLLSNLSEKIGDTRR
jgi:hypothetical protein